MGWGGGVEVRVEARVEVRGGGESEGRGEGEGWRQGCMCLSMRVGVYRRGDRACRGKW